jgi:galactokinase
MSLEKDRPEIHARFQEVFGGNSRLFRGPGRVNLIGEHTDYNGGFVMPAAIGLSCWVAAAPRSDDKLVVFSENYREIYEVDLTTAAFERTGRWFDYPLGVAWALRQSGVILDGANLYIFGEVPVGIGLSSSAAIELAVGLALADLAGRPIDRVALARLCQAAENLFVGTRCGIMDQFVSALGHSGYALFLDCRSLQYDLIPLPKWMRLVICDTTVSRELGSSEYNMRRAQCEEGAQRLASVIPGIESLRDVSSADLEAHKDALPNVILKRCRHVVSENARVLTAVSALRIGDIEVLKGVMFESHRSLRDDFEVSCRELDVMVEIASKQPGVHGARMTGGGFGGCTVNLVDLDRIGDFQRNVAAAYQTATGRQANIYVCEPSDGADVAVGASIGSLI